MKKRITILTSIIATSLFSVASAAPVVYDTFTDGDRNNDGAGILSGGVADTLDIPWFNITDATKPPSVVNDNGTPGLGGFAMKTNASNGQRIVGTLYTTGASSEFVSQAAQSSATLGTQVGDLLTLSFDYRALSTANGSANGRWIYFGLFNSEGTTITSDGDAASAANDVGYYVRMPVNTNTSSTTIFETSTVQELFGGSSIGSNATGSLAADLNPHSVKLVLERVSAGISGAVDIHFYFDGGFLLTANDLTPISTFDQIAVSYGNLNSGLMIDNVLLETGVIPEPASLALLGLGGALMAVRRRRA